MVGLPLLCVGDRVLRALLCCLVPGRGCACLELRLVGVDHTRIMDMQPGGRERRQEQHQRYHRGIGRPAIGTRLRDPRAEQQANEPGDDHGCPAGGATDAAWLLTTCERATLRSLSAAAPAIDPTATPSPAGKAMQ